MLIGQLFWAGVLAVIGWWVSQARRDRQFARKHRYL